MRRADLFLRPQLLVLLLLAGCGAPPSKPPPEPRLRLQAQQAEASGAQRFAQGDYAAAAKHFAAAARLQSSLDDASAASRNRLQLAQAQLALGQAEQALEQTDLVREESLHVQTLLLRVQALLALNEAHGARDLLLRLDGLCGAACAERGRLRLLQARMAWAGGDAAQTVQQASVALPLLRERGEERETANAWRLLAAAQLKSADAPAALAAANAALEIDRHLALPEKIVRDWLLIGDIARRAGKPEARAAYLRARSVAQAAGLEALSQLAAAALKETH